MIAVCGILFMVGPDDERQVRALLPRLSHRGPDDTQVYTTKIGTLGFVRLAINGEGSSGAQPYTYGPMVGAFNGEIYNQLDLTTMHGLPPAVCDAHVVLPLFQKQHHGILDSLDGFYSGVVVNEDTGEIWCLRDHIGKKPLFVGRSGQYVFITSELKALGHVDHFTSVPLGLSSINSETGEASVLAKHSEVKINEGLVEIFRDAVVKRLPAPDQPVGVFLSGGLDSSLVAAVVAEHRPDATYFTLGDGDDKKAVQTVVSALGLRDVRDVHLPAINALSSTLRDVVLATESYNPSIISNGLGTFVLAKAVRDAGIKVVLGGEGADELFGGYHYFSNKNSDWKDVRNRLIHDMQHTELRRLDLASMAHSIEVRCPFLDRRLRALSDALSFEQMYDGRHNKVHLRRNFADVLPAEILWRPKTSLDVGSGVRGLVTPYLRRDGGSERAVLKGIWAELFSFDSEIPYFSSYPVFDDAIDKRGVVHR